MYFLIFQKLQVSFVFPKGALVEMNNISALFILCLLFTDTTAQHERSQCPLVETDSITSLFIVYRYMTVQQKHSQCPLVEAVSNISLFIVYICDSTTGTFAVPPGGDDFYYFYVYWLHIWQLNRNIHSDP